MQEYIKRIMLCQLKNTDDYRVKSCMLWQNVELLSSGRKCSERRVPISPTTLQFNVTIFVSKSRADSICSRNITIKNREKDIMIKEDQEPCRLSVPIVIFVLSEMYLKENHMHLRQTPVGTLFAENKLAHRIRLIYQ
jgi:hypothetical protein